MAFYNLIQERLILPMSDLISGKSFSGSMKFLLKSQYWPADRHRAFQEERLRYIILHAYENVPFYHDLFTKHHLLPSDIKTIADLAKLPVINKNDLRTHPVEYYLAKNITPGNRIRMNSSGSTGEPFTYYITREAFSMNYACAIRGWYWMGYRLGDRYAKLSQNPRKGFNKKLQDLITRSQYVFIKDLTPEVLFATVRHLNRKQPEFIRCYPDPLFFIAQEMDENQALSYAPKAINTTGNILTPNARARIEKAFKAPVYDAYSCEASAQFFEGPDREAYFASMEYAISEVLNDSGNPVQSGKHITTDLWNLAMPFIRYDTQDIIERVDIVPESKIQLDAFKQIKGRNSDILITPSGKFLIVHTFTIFFEYFVEIRQFQVIQEAFDKMRILLVVNEEFNKTIESKVLAGLKDLIGKDVDIEINIVEQIPVLPSGKRRFIIRNESVTLPF